MLIGRLLLSERNRISLRDEPDRQVVEIKYGIQKKMLTNFNPLLDKMMKIALKSDSDKTSLDDLDNVIELDINAN